MDPDFNKKKGDNGEDLAKKSYMMTKFADIMTDEEEQEDSNSDFD